MDLSGRAKKPDSGKERSKEITFYLPGLKHYETNEIRVEKKEKFVAVSITGSACTLKCRHCAGKLLQHMYQVTTPDELEKLVAKLTIKGIQGILLTGGSDRQGRLPFSPFYSSLARIKRNYMIKVAVHTGLVDDRDALALKECGIDRALMDMVGDDLTIREILHLKATVSDFKNSLQRLLQAGLNVAPHVVIGLHEGLIRGEATAINIIAELAAPTLILVVFTPIPGTPMAEVSSPTPESIAAILDHARNTAPTIRLILGCIRPEGRSKEAIDLSALHVGVDGIAYPGNDIIAQAVAMGYRYRFSDDCCCF